MAEAARNTAAPEDTPAFRRRTIWHVRMASGDYLELVADGVLEALELARQLQFYRADLYLDEPSPADLNPVEARRGADFYEAIR